jgi:hypothetical protein
MSVSSVKPNTPKFSALICHTKEGADGQKPERCEQTGVPIYIFELTNNPNIPLGRVGCPDGPPGVISPAVEKLSEELPKLAQLGKEERLEEVRKAIRADSGKWQLPDGENLAKSRGKRLLQKSTADIKQNPNGSLSMIMDYDFRGDLTESLKQQEAQNNPPQSPGSSQRPGVNYLA